MMKRKKNKVIGLSIVLVLLVLVCLYLKFDEDNQNYVAVDEVSSLIEKQEELERQFKIKGYTIDQPNVVIDPYGNSPLTALILFETSSEVSVKVTVEGKDELSTFSHTFEKTKEHYLPIYGLYAGEDNRVLVEYREGNKEIRREVLIQTKELPDNFVLPTSVYADKSKLGNELYFYTPSSTGYTCAYDVNGDVRWYLSNYALWKVDRLKNGNLLLSTERLINNPYYMTGLYEMNLLGKVFVEYSLKGGYHHDYYEMENGNLLVASDDFYNDDGTVEDYIVELDRKRGEIVRKFDLKDVLKMTDGKSENWSAYDWFHNNSVWYDKKSNSITLSGRHQDAVINIDYDTGKLNWIIGDSTNWSPEYQKYFFKPVDGTNFEWQWSQHAAMITPEGYVFLFDNGNNKSKNKDAYVDATNSYSRGVMYKIDTKKMTIEQVFEYGKERGASFYSPYISDVDYLGSNHYIIHSGGIVYVDGKNSNQPAGFSKNTTLVSDTVELMDENVIFELKLPTNNYRVEKMALYQDKESVYLGSAKRVGSLGKTTIGKTEITPVVHGVSVDKEYDAHAIKFSKEIDRLVFTGTFKKGTDVEVILYQKMRSYSYPISISKKPYTALCVDVFSEEETAKGLTVTRYINAEGLSGKYAIYLKIDGKIYNTGEYVRF